MADDETQALLRRIADSLDRLAPPPRYSADPASASAFVWRADGEWLEAVSQVNRVDYDLIKGVDQQRDILLRNTLQFVRGLPANNALLWGARGMGKSSLIKSVHAKAESEAPGGLSLIEIHRDDIGSLPALLGKLRASSRRCIVFCDDLSFDSDDVSYKSLKAVLEGGIEGRPANVIFYATSNRRHLMPRDMIENERSTAINPAEAVEEKVSMSDRFGLWLGFHPCNQDVFFDMCRGYAKRYALGVSDEELLAGAVEWSVTRGGRSGRVAWQYIQDLAGRLGKPLA